jgi:exopolysaccharide production protein ExoQ
MPSQIASIVFGLFILWLFTRDRALWRTPSTALWIPVLWIVIIGSRPISSWLGYHVGGADVDLEGSPIDRLFYFALMLAAFLVLQRRKVNWGSLIVQNKWLAAYFVYLGISVLWSDEPFVSFKRWIKDVGNVIMVVTILSESDPVEAIKSVVFRCSCFLIPMSVLYIKYYPDLGRYFDRWTWQYHYGGVTTDKNTLGMSLFLCGLGLCWSFLDLWNRRAKNKKDVVAHLVLLVMCLWLYSEANCATSLACTVLGVGILLAMRIPRVQDSIRRFGLWVILIPVVFVLTLSVLFIPADEMAGSFGRNMTLTGRTDIWREALKADINPLIGAGYSSFWQGDRAAKVSSGLGFYFQLKEAHNGYIDIYLNAGLIGLALVVATLVAGGKKAFKGLRSESSYAAFRFAVLVGGIVYNVTESVLCGLAVVWVLLLLSIVEYPLALGTTAISFADSSRVVEEPQAGTS